MMLPAMPRGLFYHVGSSAPTELARACHMLNGSIASRRRRNSEALLSIDRLCIDGMLSIKHI